jgi:hypothetical protein
MQSAYCCWHRLTECLAQCTTFPCCCFPGFDSIGQTSPRHPRDFDPCFEPLVDDSGSESDQEEPTGPVSSPRGGNPTGDGVKFTAAAAVHPSAAALESATATAPKKSSPIRTKLPLLADSSPKKIKFGPPKKPPRHFDFVALAATDGGGSAPPEQSTSTPVPPDRKTASDAAAAASNSGGPRKLSPRQLFDKLRGGGGGGGGDPAEERRLITSGGGGSDKVVKQPAADSKAPRKVCYDNEGDDLCSDDERRSKSHGLKNTGECRSVTGNSRSGQLENIYVGLGGNKSSSDDTSAAIMEPEGIYAEVGWPKIAYYFINLLTFNCVS